MTMITYDQADFLCVGCFAWARAKTAREAFRAAKANSSAPNDPKKAIMRIWRIADQIDQITVSEIDGSWYGQPGEGITLTPDEGKAATRLVWEGPLKTKTTDVPELLIRSIA